MFNLFYPESYREERFENLKEILELLQKPSYVWKQEKIVEMPEMLHECNSWTQIGTDISGNTYYIELPGVKKEDIKITKQQLHNGQTEITISAKRKVRSFSSPKDFVGTINIHNEILKTVKFENGLLIIVTEFPKKEKKNLEPVDVPIE